MRGHIEKQRRRLVHPLSNVRRWRASLNHGNGKCPQDLKRDAVAAWKRFVSCVELLPPDQARPLWQAVAAEAAAHARTSAGGFCSITSAANALAERWRSHELCQEFKHQPKADDKPE
jgi:hypothetical protein